MRRTEFGTSRLRWTAAALLAAVLLAAGAATPALGAITFAFRAASQAGIPSTGGVAFGGSGAVAVANGCPASIAPALPTNTAFGDLLLAVVTSKDASAITMAGWNSLFFDNPLTNYQARIFWRIANGADPNTISKTGANCDVMIGRISRFTGVDASNPFITAPLAAGNWSFQPNANTVTTGTQDTTPIPDAMLVFVAHTGDNSTVDPAPGFTTGYDSVTTTGSDTSIALDFRLETTAGVKGPFTVSKTAGFDPNHGVLFALRPGWLTINVPAGTQADDVMIASIVVRPANMMITPPAGWTPVRLINQPAGGGTGGFGQVQATYYRVATAAEPASYTWRFSGGVSNGAAGGILSFSGVDTANPIDAEGGNTTPFSLNHTANSITTTVATAMLVSAHAMNSAVTWTPPTDMTEAVDVASRPLNAVGATIEINYELRTSMGATGSRTATVANFADNGSAQLLALRPSAGIAGFQFSLSTNASTCAPLQVTVTAVNSIGKPVTNYTGTVVLSTSTGRGGWKLPTGGGGGLFTETGTANDGVAVYSFVAGDLGSVTLELSNQSADDLTITARDSAIPATATQSALIKFRDNAFVIIATDAMPLGDVPVAGRPHPLRAQLWERDPTSNTCQIATSYNGKKALDAWVSLDPDHPTGAILPQIDVPSLPSTPLPGVPPNTPPPPVDPASNNLSTLNFVNGEADFTLTTGDVGKYALNLRDDTRDFASGVDILGGSPTLTVRPFALVVSDIHQGGATNSNNPGPGGQAFAKAGTPFQATVSAHLWNGAADGNNDGVPDAGTTLAQVTAAGATPSYNWLTTLTAGAPITPAGGILGSFTGGPLPSTASPFVKGEATAINLSYDEVGSFTLTANAANFLNTSTVNLAGIVFDNSGARNAVVGRFIPDHFELSGGTLTNRVLAACSPASTFTYMDEGMGVSFTLTALAKDGSTITRNYSTASGFAKLDPVTQVGVVGLGFGARNGATSLSARLDTLVSGSFANGVSSVSATVALGRASPDTPDGPFDAFELGAAPQDSDGVQLNTFDLSIGGVDHRKIGLTTKVRFGRLRLGNALGSELLDLPLPISVQYWNGTGFVTNGDDSCTRLSSANVGLSNFQNNLGAGETTAAPTPTISFANGVGSLRLTKPGAGNNGSVNVTVNLTAEGKSYLKGRWNDGANPDGDVNTAYDDDPVARASFGLYKGPSEIIYLRENF